MLTFKKRKLQRSVCFHVEVYLNMLGGKSWSPSIRLIFPSCRCSLPLEPSVPIPGVLFTLADAETSLLRLPVEAVVECKQQASFPFEIHG
jgi:hypothetical protein